METNVNHEKNAVTIYEVKTILNYQMEPVVSSEIKILYSM